MGGSSSQPHTEPPMSLIHAFPIEDMYSAKFSDSFQQNTDSFQETAREDSPIEVATPPPKSKSKPTRGRQKRMVQNEDAPRQIAWTNKEEIALCKGWVHVSESSKLGNTRRDVGFWTEVLEYMESKTKLYGRRTRVEPETKITLIQHFLTMKLKPDKNEVPQSLCEDWQWQEMGIQAICVSRFVCQTSCEILPMCMDKAKGFMKKKGPRASGLSSTNDEAMARLMVSEIAMHNECAIEMQKEKRKAFLEIKRREVECREQELANQEYRQCQEDIRLCSHTIDHLIGDAWTHMKELRAEIKAKWNLPY
ncbi:hypothetical protein Tco_1268443 [Tanacetum coccineum]